MWYNLNDITSYIAIINLFSEIGSCNEINIRENIRIIPFSPKLINLTEGYCFSPFRPSIFLSVRLLAFDMQWFVRGTLVWSLCSRVLKLHTVKGYILQMCNVEVSVWSTNKCWNYWGLNLEEFEIFFVYLYGSLSIKHRERLRVYRYVVYEYLRAMIKKDVVRNMLWERRCEENVVRKTWWEEIFLLNCFS